MIRNDEGPTGAKPQIIFGARRHITARFANTGPQMLCHAKMCVCRIKQHFQWCTIFNARDSSWYGRVPVNVRK